MSSVQNRSRKAAGNGLDAVIEIVWIASEIAMYVVGMFFWAAILLFWIKAVT